MDIDTTGDIDPPTLPSPERTRETIVSFIRQAVEAADADGLVINLSGGLDSTVSATLATAAVHAHRVEGLILPANANDESNIEAAAGVAKDLGITYSEYDIQPILDAFVETMVTEVRHVKQDPLDDGSKRITVAPRDRPDFREAIGNTAARVRMAVAYFEANTRNRLVLGTGNRTELLLGYFTKYGDGGVDLLPLGNLYKTEVRDLATHLGVPTSIIEKPPTAGLWRGQTDESELGADYETIDTVLAAVIDDDRDPGSVAHEFDLTPETVSTLMTMIESSQHKRAMPPMPTLE